MYRLTFADATAAGLTDAGLDPRSFRLTLMGEELPIEVTGESDGSFDPGDAITFYAPRNRGVDGEYHDEWMDDNVFLLSWGGAAGLRRGSEDVAPSSHPGAQTITHYPLRLHFEENHAYHRGDFEHIDMAVTTRVTGEGWVWSYLLKRDTIAAEFDLPASIDRDGMLRVRARGASVDTSLMRVFLNGTVIGESRVPPYTFITPEYTVPEALLRVAGNVLRVESVGLVTCPPEDPACSIERFFVDWMQLHLSVDVTGSAAPLTLDPSVRLPGMALPATFLLNRTATTGVLEGINLRSGARLDGIATASSRAELVLDSGGVYHLYEPSAVRTPESVELITLNGYAKSAPQVDYLVISHRNFLPQARRIAEYRASADGFTILVADVEDLYTEFNHGHKDPVAIRRFVQHFRENAPDPKPQFLLIVGDASWDPKRHMASSTKTDFVPAYGNPISDNYYVSFDETEFDPWPEMAVGRIPAETPGAADAVIDKIIASETAPPQPWDNRYLFSVGGQNSLEQISLRDAVDPLIANYVLPNCLESRYIIKKTLDLVSYDDLDTLISEVNAGVSWFFFSGHGGTRVIDVGIERPDIFDNEDKYLFFVTMSCNTAHFAEPFETGLNERFVISPRNGAVAAFGTSGVGEITPDYYVSRGMFRALIDSSVRTYGELALLGKRHLLSTSGITTVNRRTVNQLCILGDPATKVPLARTPELALRSEEIRTDPEIVSEQTQTVIHTTFRNYGLCVSDSIDVLLTVRSAGIDVFSQQRRIPPFRLDTLLQWEYDFSGVDGEVQISAEIDPGNRIAERDESNNRATATLNVLPRGVTQIFPLDRAVVIQVEDETLFLIANPSYVPDASLNPRMELEISFDPDFLFIAQRLERDPEPVYTGFPVDLRQWDGVLYWRARMVTDGGPERWSTVRSFTAGGGGFSDERWQQTDGPQFETTTVDGLQQVTGGGLQLGDRPLVLEAFSGGFNGPLKQAVLRVNGVEYRPVHPDSARGFNVAVVEPRFGDVVDLRLFDTYPGREAAAEMAAFLRSIPDDHILMVAVQDDANGYPPSSIDGTNISSELKTELKQFGARMIDSVGFRDSWALIGSRATAADAKDQHFVLGTVIIRDTVVVEAREGRFITSVIGPVNSISAVRWDGEAGDDSASVDLRVHALLGERDSLIAVFPRLTPGQRALLPAPEDIPSAFVRIEGVLRDGRGNGSPLLRSLHADYVSRFPEIGITSQVVDVSADSLLEGEPLTVTASVYNAGRIRAEGLRVRLAVPGTQTVVEHALPPIEADRTG
ncbi:MAG: hypothetical protein JXA28_14755, partial [Bacteroidetes bacterium]|nr:hypothetical protein [Bacteroidota bacterium]